MVRSTLLWGLSIAAVFLSGCGAWAPSSIIPSTSPLPPHMRGTIETTASNCQYRLLGIIPVTASPNSQEALSEAKRNIDVDVLTDVTIDHNAGYYIFWSDRCVRVSGMGVHRDRIKSDSRANYESDRSQRRYSREDSDDYSRDRFEEEDLRERDIY